MSSEENTAASKTPTLPPVTTTVNVSKPAANAAPKKRPGKEAPASWILGPRPLGRRRRSAFVAQRSPRDREADRPGKLLVTVEKKTLDVEIFETGKIAPRIKSDVKSKIAGTVAKVLVQEGDTVKEWAAAPDARPDGLHPGERARRGRYRDRECGALDFSEALARALGARRRPAASRRRGRPIRRRATSARRGSRSTRPRSRITWRRITSRTPASPRRSPAPSSCAASSRASRSSRARKRRWTASRSSRSRT